MGTEGQAGGGEVELYVGPKGAHHSLSDFLKLVLYIFDDLFK